MMPLNAVILLFAKITLLLLSALLALASARRATAAMRHMLCLSALAGSLILPFFGLLPASVLMIRVPVDAVAGVRAAAPASGWPWSRLAVTLWLSGSALLLLRLAAGYWAGEPSLESRNSVADISRAAFLCRRECAHRMRSTAASNPDAAQC
jgi:hypothetical protein